jgi:hypothetical protein
VVLTYSKNDDNNQLKLYVNGTLIDTQLFTEPINTNTNPLYFGKYFNGIIDEIYLYDRALSQEEALISYNLYKK